MAEPRRGRRPPARSRRRGPWGLLALAAVVAVVLFAAGLVVGRGGWPPAWPWGAEGEGPADGRAAEPAAPRADAPARPPRSAPQQQPVAPPAAPAPDRPAGHVALVIDDLGRSLDDLDALAALDVPLSYSVLPFEERTAEVVARLRAERREILCHLPMQPGNGRDPGPGALHAAMGDHGLARAARAALARVPGAVGVNNHMGSSLTADPAAMAAILQVLQQDGLFFLDSRTSSQSVGYRLARSLGLPSAERDVFLDDDLAPEAIRAQFARLLERSRAEGAAIAIAHPHPATLAVLREEVPRAQEAGFTFVPVSFLLDRTGEPL